MKDFTKIDKNFAIETNIQREGLVFFDPEDQPFSFYGVYREGEKFVRLPEKVAAQVNDGVHEMCGHLTGGRIRFCTDSPYVAVSAKYNQVLRMDHFALTGSAGMDLYADNIYVRSFRPSYDLKDKYEGVIDFGNSRMREITINLPTYSGIDKIYVGLKSGSKIEKASDYKITRPVVFYGSSITHGGCCSRPGMTYEAILSRRFGFDYVNLGFSGSARAEDAMCDYISSLDMSLFVYDYDHNSPSLDHLEKTHERFFLRFREKQPDTPVIMMSRPVFFLMGSEWDRRDIILKTYCNAVARGDKKVWYIDGTNLMDVAKDNGTVDGCHPTDFGFWNMAKTLGDEIEKNYTRIFG